MTNDLEWMLAEEAAQREYDTDPACLHDRAIAAAATLMLGSNPPDVRDYLLDHHLFGPWLRGYDEATQKATIEAIVCEAEKSRADYHAAVLAHDAIPAFYLHRTYLAALTPVEGLLCKNDAWCQREHCYFEYDHRSPVIRIWKTAAGAQRWLDQHPDLRDERVRFQIEVRETTRGKRALGGKE